jgi:mannan endo-1,4-beta-mannosidase
MRAATHLLTLLAACRAGTEPAQPQPIVPQGLHTDVTIDVGADRNPISPYIYGSNQDDGANVWTVRREGGNRVTGYNWENNFSNAGSDWFHSSDLFMIVNAGIPAAEASIPARAITHFHDQSIAMGAKSIVSLQMAGYAARDGNGTVTAAETAPSARWVKVEPKKPTPFVSSPDLADGVVYMDELVSLLVRQYGSAATPNGVRWYSLDNEPALWSSTHPRIHPQPVGADELVTRSIALASATKDVDPSAQIIGPALYGIAAYVSLQDAPDWPRERQGYSWFVDYYLDRMRQSEQSGGRKLLDALDVHWYPEARGDHRITDTDATTAKDAAARVQAPRTLWDSTYHEDSWVAQYLSQYLPILPRLRRSIDQYYPGTKLALTEYNFGGGASISGGLAQADVLGIFGRSGVYLATIWGIGTSDLYASAGFKLYRDYDGRGGTFGATSVRAYTSDVDRSSAYASVDDGSGSPLHVILINKSDVDALAVHVQLSGGASYTSGQVWGFDDSSPRITARQPVGAIANAFDYLVPPRTAIHVVLR